MIGCGFSMFSSAVLGAGGGGLGWEYIGASAPVDVTNTTATCTLPETAVAGDLIILIASSAGTFSSSSLPTVLVPGLTRQVYGVAAGGETTASITFTTSLRITAVALVFRPQGALSAGATASASGASPAAIAGAITTRPALGIFFSTCTVNSVTSATASELPVGAVNVVNIPIGVFGTEGLYVTYALFTANETSTGNYRAIFGALTTTQGLRVFELS